MHFNLYVNDDLIDEMKVVMKKTGKKRNTIIVEAIKEYLEKRAKKGWSKKIMEFNGIEGLEDWEGFEADRKDMKAPRENIFGEDE
jgi:hypothetical protein